jgi:hypothetical protein
MDFFQTQHKILSAMGITDQGPIKDEAEALRIGRLAELAHRKSLAGARRVAANGKKIKKG